MKTRFYTLLVTLFLIIACGAKYNCETLPDAFPDYKEALKTVKNTDFEFTESVDTREESSFIDHIAYYSCDKETGYLIVKMHDKEYIYQNISWELWKRFKGASSYGKFYQKHKKTRERGGANERKQLLRRME